MRWKTKNIPPWEGERRTVYPFAWLPTAVQNNETVWLEQFEAIQVYTRHIDYSFGAVWCCWETLERRALMEGRG